MVNYSDGALNRIWIYGLLGLFPDSILEFYNGVQPSSANLAPEGDVLLRMTLPEVLFKFIDVNKIEIFEPWVSQIGDVILAGSPTWSRIRFSTDPNLDDSLGQYPRLDSSVGIDLNSEMVISSEVITNLTILTIQTFTIIKI